MYVASKVIGNAYKLNERQTNILSTILELLSRCHFLVYVYWQQVT